MMYSYIIMSCFIISIIIEISVGASVHEKGLVNGLNTRDNWMLKLVISRIINTELI